jgi:hypothetical protein
MYFVCFTLYSKSNKFETEHCIFPIYFDVSETTGNSREQTINSAFKSVDFRVKNLFSRMCGSE